MDEEKIKEMLNGCAVEKNSEDDSSRWLMLFLTLFMMNSKSGATELEKEVSYLHGKVDTLEKLLTRR